MKRIGRKRTSLGLCQLQGSTTEVVDLTMASYDPEWTGVLDVLAERVVGEFGE